jgi:hypothetical protein
MIQILNVIDELINIQLTWKYDKLGTNINEGIDKLTNTHVDIK